MNVNKSLNLDIFIKDAYLIGIYKLISSLSCNQQLKFSFYSNRTNMRIEFNKQPRIKTRIKITNIRKISVYNFSFMNSYLKQANFRSFKFYSNLRIYSPLLSFNVYSGSLARVNSIMEKNETIHIKPRNPVSHIVNLIKQGKCFPRIIKEFRKLQPTKLKKYQYELGELITIIEWMKCNQDLYYRSILRFVSFYDHVLIILKSYSINSIDQERLLTPQVRSLLIILHKVLKLNYNDIDFQKRYIETMKFLVLDGHSLIIFEYLILALEKSKDYSLSANILEILTRLWITENYFNMMENSIIKEKVNEVKWANFTTSLNLEERLALVNKIKDILIPDNFNQFISLGKFWTFNGFIKEALELFLAMKQCDRIQFQLKLNFSNCNLKELILRWKNQIITKKHIELLFIFNPTNNDFIYLIRFLKYNPTQFSYDINYITILEEIEYYILMFRKNKSLSDYELLIEIYCLLGKVDNVLDIISTIKQLNLSIRPNLMTLILSNHIKSISTSKFEHLFKILTTRTPNLNIVHFTVLLMKYSNNPIYLPKMLEVIEYIEKSEFDLKPDIVMFQVLINTFISQDKNEFLSSCLNGMKKAGISPDTKIYTSLLKYFSYQKKHNHVLFLLEQVNNSNLPIDSIYIEAVLKSSQICNINPINIENFVAPKIIQIYRNNPEIGFKLLNSLILYLSKDKESINQLTIRILNSWAPSPYPLKYAYFSELISSLILELFKFEEHNLLCLIWYYFRFYSVNPKSFNLRLKYNTRLYPRIPLIRLDPIFLSNNQILTALSWGLDKSKSVYLNSKKNIK